MLEPGENEGEMPVLDAGPLRGRRGAERTCIVTRVVRPPASMIRFVRTPDGSVVPDLRARLPGRGAWVTATREAVETAVKRRHFRRAFRSERADPASDLPESIAMSLRTDLRQALSLANKAGCAVTGFSKVEAVLTGRERVAALIHASDASADGRRKLASALHRGLGDAKSTVAVIDDLSNAELDMAFGRDHVIHAALIAGAGSTGVLACWCRLRAYEGDLPSRGASAAMVDTPPAAAGATISDLHDDEMTDRSGATPRWPADDTMTAPKGLD